MEQVVSAYLAIVMNEAEKTPYGKGGKTYSAFDCSGLVQTALLTCMKRINKDLGYEFYDMRKMGQLLACGSAEQIKNMGKRTGYLSEEKLVNENVAAGTIIGVQKKGKDDITHIAFVLKLPDASGKLMPWVVEMTKTGTIGPKITRLGNWAHYRINNGSTLWGVNFPYPSKLMELSSAPNESRPPLQDNAEASPFASNHLKTPSEESRKQLTRRTHSHAPEVV